MNELEQYMKVLEDHGLEYPQRFYLRLSQDRTLNRPNVFWNSLRFVTRMW
ncbi:hypothetical protein NK8_83280 (plasmid) [Caballeronia sp. NK8]|nr:hypothetical protein NK8_83280 [Caballeronia sp. NK8]